MNGRQRTSWRKWGAGGALAAALAVGVTVGAHAAEFARAYNGTDLSGWHVEGGKLEMWKANGELLSCAKGGSGYLCLDKEYGDFELKLEWRVPKGGNSGVGVHFPKGGWPSTDGFEVQILDDDTPNNQKLKPDNQCGSIYTHIAPKAKAAKAAGEWNQYVIRCEGPKVQVWLNGTQIQDVNLDADGKTKGKGKTLLSERPRKGLVGLQSHGDPVDFKNIEIREL